MDGENHGNPELKVDALGGKPTIFGKHPCDRFNPQQMEKKKREHEKKMSFGHFGDAIWQINMFI